MATIKNVQSAPMSNATLKHILAQLRKLRGMIVVRDNRARTVIAYTLVSKRKVGKGRHEFLRAMQLPTTNWLVRFDSKLVQRRAFETSV